MSFQKKSAAKGVTGGLNRQSHNAVIGQKETKQVLLSKFCHTLIGPRRNIGLGNVLIWWNNYSDIKERECLSDIKVKHKQGPLLPRVGI